MKYFILFHSVCCLLGGLKTLRDGFITEKDSGATFAILSGTTMMTCDMSKWTEWSSCRQLGSSCRNIQTRLRRCFTEKLCCEKARRHLSEIRKCDNFDTEWLAWSPCSKSCGSDAVRSRSAKNCDNQQNEACASNIEDFAANCPEIEPIVLKATDNGLKASTEAKSGLWWPAKSEKSDTKNIELEEKFSMSDFVPVLKLIEALGPDAIRETSERIQCQSEWENCYHQVVKEDSIGQKWTLVEQATSTECISFKTKSSESSVCFCF